MLGFLTKYVRSTSSPQRSRALVLTMRRAVSSHQRSRALVLPWVLMACVVSGFAGAVNADEPVVTVIPLLLMEPSTEETTTELSSMGIKLADPGELLPGETIYMEIWFQTIGPNGIASALLNIEYETDLLDTSVEQITLASPWTDLWATVRSVNDATGLITDVGGISIVGHGLEPQWTKLATIEFDVIETPGTGIIASCTLDGGPNSGFGMVGIGEVEEIEIDYRCACATEISSIPALSLIACLSGPDVRAARECTCTDVNRDMHVDLVDFAAFQVAFRGAE